MELISGFILTLLAFLFVYTLVFALLSKTKILGEREGINLSISLIISFFFVLSPLTTKFSALTIPWIVVFIIMVFFMLFVISFVRGKIDDLVKSPIISLILVIIVLIIFIFSALNVFGPLISQRVLSPEAQSFWNYLTQPSFIALATLLIIAFIVFKLLKK